jgi:hypothetical protein
MQLRRLLVELPLSPCFCAKVKNVFRTYCAIVRYMWWFVYIFILYYIECSLCRLIRRLEHLIGRHWYLPANWRSFIRWSPDQWVSQRYAIERDRSFYCALFCVFMSRVSQCPMSLRSEHPIVWYSPWGLYIRKSALFKPNFGTSYNF